MSFRIRQEKRKLPVSRGFQRQFRSNCCFFCSRLQELPPGSEGIENRETHLAARQSTSAEKNETELASRARTTDERCSVAPLMFFVCFSMRLSALPRLSFSLPPGVFQWSFSRETLCFSLKRWIVALANKPRGVRAAPAVRGP